MQTYFIIIRSCQTLDLYVFGAGKEYLASISVAGDAVDDRYCSPVGAHPEELVPDGETAACSVRIHVRDLNLEGGSGVGETDDQEKDTR